MFNHYDRKQTVGSSPPQLLRSTSFSLPPDLQTSRLSSLKSTIHSLLSRIHEDPMLKLLSSERLSPEVLDARVNELFSEVIENEREAFYSGLLDKANKEILSLKEQLLHGFEQNERSIKYLKDQLEKSERLITFEQSQNEKLAINYADAMSKITENSKQFDKILLNNQQDSHKGYINLKLSNSELNDKLQDFEGICEKMDQEINALTIQKDNLTILLDKTTLKSREQYEKLLNTERLLKNKEQDFINLKGDFEIKFTELKEKGFDLEQALILKEQEYEALKEENARYIKQLQKSFINELEEKVSKEKKEENERGKERIKRRKEEFKNKRKVLEDKIFELEKEVNNQKKAIEEVKRRDEEEIKRKDEELRCLLEKFKREHEEIEGKNEEMLRIQAIEKEKLEEKWRKKEEGLIRDFEEKNERFRKEERGKKLQSISGFKEIDMNRKSSPQSKIKGISQGFEGSLLKRKTTERKEIMQSTTISILNNEINHNYAFQDQIKTLTQLNTTLKTELTSTKSSLKHIKDQFQALSAEKDELEITHIRLSRSLEDSSQRFQSQILLLHKKLSNSDDLQISLSLENELLKKELESKKFLLNQSIEDQNLIKEDIRRKEQELLNSLRSLEEAQREIQRDRQEFIGDKRIKDEEIGSLKEVLAKKEEELSVCESELKEIKEFLLKKEEENMQETSQNGRIFSEQEARISFLIRENEEIKTQTIRFERDKEESLVSNQKKIKQKILLKERLAYYKGNIKKELKHILLSLEGLKKESEKIRELVKKGLRTRIIELMEYLPELQRKNDIARDLLKEKLEFLFKEKELKGKALFEEKEDILKEAYLKKEALLQSQFENLQELVKRTHEEKNGLLGKIEGLINKIEALKEEGDSFKNKGKSLEEELLKGKERETRLITEIKGLKDGICELKSKYQKGFEELNENLTRYKENQKEELEQLSGNYEEFAETLQGQGKKLEEECNELQETIQSKENAIENLENEIKKLNDEREVFLEGLESMRIGKEKVQKALKEEIDDKKGLEIKLNILEGDLKDKNRLIMLLEDEKNEKEAVLKGIREREKSIIHEEDERSFAIEELPNPKGFSPINKDLLISQRYLSKREGSFNRAEGSFNRAEGSFNRAEGTFNKVEKGFASLKRELNRKTKGIEEGNKGLFRSLQELKIIGQKIEEGESLERRKRNDKGKEKVKININIDEL